MRSLIDITDFTVEELDSLISTAKDIMKNGEKYADACRGKKLATLFFEPSTRTRLSFEAAMLELGGSVIGFSEASSSSAAKGESVADTAKVLSAYADIIAMRHPKDGAPFVASLNATIPVINAGDGCWLRLPGHSFCNAGEGPAATIILTLDRFQPCPCLKPFVFHNELEIKSAPGTWQACKL